MIGIIVAYTILQFILLKVSNGPNSKKYYVPAKSICSTAFVLAGLYFACSADNMSYFFLMLPSLLLCLLGDVFMGMYNQFHRKRQMLLGIVFFLTAHIGYIFMLYHIHPNIVLWDMINPIVGVMGVILVGYVAKLHMGKLRVAVAIYAVFISALFAKCIHYMVAMQTTTAVLMGVGGILFFTSDFLILFLYFYHFTDKRKRQQVHYLNLLTYYYAVLCFDLSILYF